MTYEQSLKYITKLNKFGIKLGLQRINRLLQLMNNPHKNLKFIHIAGTNGKGSTASFINNILIESGYKVGLYTSPYVNEFSERIQINNENISNENIAKITTDIKFNIEHVEKNGHEHPTEFEIITAMAFQYFYDEKCDIVALETGLGGKLDSTNIIDNAEVTVITTIDYDHMNILGETLTKIAKHKAGIIKQNATVVLYPQECEIEKLFEKYCYNKNAKLKKVCFKDVQVIDYNVDRQIFNYNEYKDVCIKMLGKNQIYNCIMAINVAEQLICKGYNITNDTIKKGLLKSRWEGRFEIVSKKPVFIIDGAHNRQGAKMLGNNLTEYFLNKEVIFIFGVLSDKEYNLMIDEVKNFASKFIVVTIKNERALESTHIVNYINKLGINVETKDSIESAVKTSLLDCTNEQIICAFGSLYYIGEIKKYLKNNKIAKK